MAPTGEYLDEAAFTIQCLHKRQRSPIEAGLYCAKAEPNWSSVLGVKLNGAALAVEEVKKEGSWNVLVVPPVWPTAESAGMPKPKNCTMTDRP